MSIEEKEAQRMLEQLSLYYRQPVMPLSHFCKGLEKWGKAMSDSKGGYESLGRDVLSGVYAARKSNLLFRIFFLNEDPRKEKCPKHKGIWSGCIFENKDACDCMSGNNVTGWLPDKD